MDRDLLLPARFCPDCQRIDLLDLIVGQRQTTDSYAISVNEDVTTGRFSRRPCTVHGIWIRDAKRKMKAALWIKPVDVIRAFRYLHIALLNFRSDTATCCADRIRSQQHERIGFCNLRPYFKKRIL